MKLSQFLLTMIFFTLLFSFHSKAQITNLTLNSYSSHAVITQGQGLIWECNLPVGGTATIEVWVDIDGNGQINAAIDKSIFGTFAQVDGDQSGNGGPNDMDNLVNGHLYLNMPDLTLAPAKYILLFSNNGFTTSISGTVLPMPSPQYTITGKVTAPPGTSAENLLISAESKSSGMNQCMAITDASGNYSLNFTNSAYNLSFSVYVKDVIQPYIPLPTDTLVTLSASISGLNFTYIKAAAQLVGYIKGDDNHVFANARVEVSPRHGGDGFNVYTDSKGFFQFGFSVSQISNYPIWRINTRDGFSPLYLAPQSGDISLHQGDSMRVDLTAYVTNDSITGYVLLDGSTPKGISFEVNANVQDTANAFCDSDPNTGVFTLKVSNKFSYYYKNVNNLNDQYGFDWNNGEVHPGDKNIVYSIQTVAWLPQTSNANNSLNSVYFVNSSTGWSVGKMGTIISTTNGGDTWSSRNSNTSSDLNGVVFANSTTGWVVGVTGIIKKTTDGGISWTSQNSTTALDLYAVSFSDVNTGWAVGGSNNGASIILKTTNGGGSWITQRQGFEGPVYSISMIGPFVGYCGTSYGNILKTTDGGASWNSSNLQGGGLSSIRFANENIGWVLGNNNWIYSTTDGGNNWSNTTLMTGTLRALFVFNANKVWVVGDNNTIYRTGDGGQTWTKQSTSSRNNFSFRDVFFTDAGNGWVVCDNGSILHTSNGGAVRVDDKVISTESRTFTLEQNYPNPFNPSTVIRYSIPSDCAVLLKIFDLLGNEVTTLVNTQMKKGVHEVTFDGSRFTTGVYFYRITADKFNSTKKLLLIK